jgi:hypothetical protein
MQKTLNLKAYVTVYMNRIKSKMKIPVIILTALLVLLLFSTCYYDSIEYLFPEVNNQCDTTQVTLALSVRPILENSCYSCHSNSTYALGGNIKLENYNNLKVQADNGHLLGAINHENGFSPMPMGAGKLENCKITIIKIWIDAGSPDN